MSIERLADEAIARIDAMSLEELRQDFIAHGYRPEDIKIKPEYQAEAIAIPAEDEVASATVLNFSNRQKEKRLSAAKRRVYQAASKLTW